MHIKFWLENLKGGDPLEIILKWILEKQGVKVWTGFSLSNGRYL
jgi:hypothetical protein